jgi:hypothetical protein
MELQEALSVLGVEPMTSLEDARQAYKRRATLVHPDRYSESPPNIRDEAHRAMSQLNEAWELVRTAGTYVPLPRPTPEGQRPLRRPSASECTACTACGAYPAAAVSFQWQLGMVLFWRLARVEGNFCAACARHLYNDAQYRTLTRGWWGLVAFFRNWFALMANRAALHRIRRLPEPIGVAEDVVAMFPFPLPPTRSAFLRPSAVLASALAAMVAVTISIAAAAPSSSPDATATAPDVALVDQQETFVDRCVNTEGRFVGCDNAAAAGRVTALATEAAICDGRGDLAVPLNDESGYACVRLLP